MYGLPQAGILAQQLLEKQLNDKGYSQDNLVPGLWTHSWRPITLTLCVDDFGVKYVGKKTPLTSSPSSKNITLFQKTGTERVILEWTSTGTTTNMKYTCPCCHTFNMTSHVFATPVPANFKTNPIPTSSQHTEPRQNMQQTHNPHHS